MKVDSTSPLHHPPAIAIAVVVVSIAVTILSMALGTYSLSSFTLEYGKGLIPLQWITSTFVHPSILILCSTLIPLACFSVFVEGKVGTPMFVISLLLISVISNAASQFVLKDFRTPAETVAIDTSDIIYPGRETPLTEEEKKLLADADAQRKAAQESTMTIAPGASATVFGLMVICLMWAPGSSFVIGEDSGAVKIPLIVPVVLFLGAEVAKWYFTNFSLSGLPVHLIGIVPGLALGGFFFASGVVGKTSTARSSSGLESLDVSPEERQQMRKLQKQRDADLRRDRKLAAKQKEQLLRESAAIVKPKQEQQVSNADPLIEKAREALNAGEPVVAFGHLMELKYPYERKHFEVDEFNKIAQHFVKEKDWNMVMTVLKESIAAHESDAIEHQLQLAKIYLAMKRPDDCQARLGKIPRKDLTPPQRERYRELVLQLRRVG